MFRQPWSVSDCANRESRRLVEHVETALVAAGDGGEDDASLTLESFCSTVYQGFERFRVLRIYKVDERRVDPPACFDLQRNVYE